MADELVGALRRELLDRLVDPEVPDLRIVDTAIAWEGRSLQVRVWFAQGERQGDFVRPFDETDLQMLTEATVHDTAAAIATWVRLELAEHISELIAEGRWR